MSTIAQTVKARFKLPIPIFIDHANNKTERIALARAYRRNTAVIILSLILLLGLNIADVITTDRLLRANVHGAVTREDNQLAWLAYNAKVLLWFKLVLWINLFYRGARRPWIVKPRKLESLYLWFLGSACGTYGIAIYSNLGNIHVMQHLP